MAVPEKVQKALREHLWKRQSQAGLAEAFMELGIPTTDPFFEFYVKYAGPFGSRTTGHELLDVIVQKESIITNTRIVRDEFDFPKRYLAISTLLGGGILVYDVQSGAVYDVDFEGGDRLLVEGKLAPSWNTWWEFLESYLA